jgi:hypothetical protein
LTLVAQGRPARVGPSRELASDDLEELRHDDKRHFAMHSPLDETHAGGRQTDRVSDASLAQVARDASVSQFPNEVVEDPLAAPTPSIRCPLPRRHPRIVAGGA